MSTVFWRYLRKALRILYKLFHAFSVLSLCAKKGKMPLLFGQKKDIMIE